MKKKNNRSFISETYKNKTFLVFYCSDNKKRSSLGPFKDENDAHFEMNQYLLQGICSWIVCYNE